MTWFDDGGNTPPHEPPARRAQCTCGAVFLGATTEAAWLLLDAHCDLEHGRQFPIHTRAKGELSMSAGAVKSRRRRDKRGHW